MKLNIKKWNFTSSEIVLFLVLLIIVAAVTSTQFISLKKEDPVSILNRNIVTVRKAIEIYYQQHGQNYPASGIAVKTFGSKCTKGVTYNSADISNQFIDQMVLYTDRAGNTCPRKSESLGFVYGPYVNHATLVNPLSLKNSVKVDRQEIKLDSVNVDNTTGWIFMAQSGKFIANELSNQIF